MLLLVLVKNKHLILTYVQIQCKNKTYWYLTVMYYKKWIDKDIKVLDTNIC